MASYEQRRGLFACIASVDCHHVKAHIILPKACQIDFEKFGKPIFMYN
jgi:hypothetical protein